MVDIEQGEKTAQRATLIVAGLAILKGVVGITTNSAALLADALHSTVDVLTAAGTWLGLKIARRPANERFPYGYYRAESIVALIVSAVIIFGAVELFLDGVNRIQHPEAVHMPALAAAVAAISAITSYYISRMEKDAAEVANSEALKTVSVEAMADTLSSLAVFLAIVAGAYLGIPWAEGVGALLVAAWVFKIGVESAWNAILSLMDVAPEDIRKEVEEILEHIDEISGYEDLRLRKAGPMVFGEVTVEIPADIPVARADEIAERVRELVKAAVPEIEDFRVFVGRKEPEEKVIVIPVTENGKLSPSFAMAPRFAAYRVKKNSIEKIGDEENPARKRRVRRGLAAAKFVVDTWSPYAVLVKNIGEISFNALREQLVEVYKVDAKTAEEAIRAFVGGKAERLEEPTVTKE